MKIALLSNVNLDMIRQYLKDYEVYQVAGYNQWIQESLNPSSNLINFKPNAIFLVLDGNALIEASQLGVENQDLLNYVNYCKQLVNNFPSTPIFISNIDLCPKQIIPSDTLRSEHELCNYWDKLLNDIINDGLNVHLFDLRNIIENYGRSNFYSDKMWYLGSIPYNINAHKIIANYIDEKLLAYNTVRKKVLILDLDNTLWGGVLGEDGIEGIKLSNNLIGAAYRDAQIRIKELTKMGVLLAIVSKNNEDDVYRVLNEHPNMVLKPNDFVAIYANWDEKYLNIKKLASILNLGLDSFVFLDDNPVEREKVKIELPSVNVVEFPLDISKLPNTIQDLAKQYFYTFKITSEDIKKTKLYQEDAQRSAALVKSASIEDYLLSLEMKIVLNEVTSSQIERTVQLINKTNQFNLTTKRYSLEELVAYKEDKNNLIFVANVTDKYGDSGLILVLMVSQYHSVAKIDNFLMSCRVMGRFIEDSIINKVEEILKQKGVIKIEAEFIPTSKNSPVENLLERLDYSLIDKDDEGRKKYIRNLSDPINQRKVLFDVKLSVN